VTDDPLAEWADLKRGLDYQRDADVVYYQALTPFYVDGIRYEWGNPTVGHIRTMMQVLDGGGAGADMWCSQPPTEAELDEYQKTGFLSGRRVG